MKCRIRHCNSGPEHLVVHWGEQGRMQLALVDGQDYLREPREVALRPRGAPELSEWPAVEAGAFAGVAEANNAEGHALLSDEHIEQKETIHVCREDETCLGRECHGNRGEDRAL